MRGFEREFKIGHDHIRVGIDHWNDVKDMYPAICSGIPFSPIQYLLLDYDLNYAPREWQHIVHEYRLRRAMVVQSSPRRHWLVSFSFMDDFNLLEIMWHCSADREHCAYMMRDGFVGIRLKIKVAGYPKLLYEIINDKGTVGYDYNKEREFRRNFGMEVTNDGRV
jgi:hypothetical protein